LFSLGLEATHAAAPPGLLVGYVSSVPSRSSDGTNNYLYDAEDRRQYPNSPKSDWGQTKRTPLKDPGERRHELLPAPKKTILLDRSTGDEHCLT
jgi:hypothetical protein